jgi:hypothetical protein
MAHQKRGIRIGDVGTLNADGAFHFLFNICKPGAGNPTKLPDEFELLELLESDIISYRKFARRASLTSDHVKHVREGGKCDW